jgi:hypothetical protein
MSLSQNVADLQRKHVVMELECIDRMYLNGHEHLKRQLAKTGIGFEPLDNGLRSCADVPAAQRICDGLSAKKIDAFFRKWLARLPHPYSAKDRRAGYRYALSTFQVGRRLENLDALRQIGFTANRRVLEVEKVSHDCHMAMEAFQRLQGPIEVEEQRASALRFGGQRVQALFTALCLFAPQPRGFTNKELRPLLAQLLGCPQKQMTQGRMSYDLRRLRLHQIIQRIEKTQRSAL